MFFLVTSAVGANGNGYGALLAFDRDGGRRGTFSGDGRIIDPRGLAVDEREELLFPNSGADRVLALDPDGKVTEDTGPIVALNPGGGNFGPDGQHFVRLRNARTIMAFPAAIDTAGEHAVPPDVVLFPRGFAFGHDGRLFLASGAGPSGERDHTIAAFGPNGAVQRSRAVRDPQLSLLDLRSRQTATSSCRANARSGAPMP
jgi:hypothetical protein